MEFSVLSRYVANVLNYGRKNVKNLAIKSEHRETKKLIFHSKVHSIVSHAERGTKKCESNEIKIALG